MKRFLFWSMFMVLCANAIYADVRLPKTFTDNAVLQRDMPVAIWGWADPGETVTVSYADQVVSGVANEEGTWLVRLAPMAGSFEERNLTIKGKNTLRLNNIVVGDVWVCSGQSNMELPLEGFGRPCGTEEELNGDFSKIRSIKVQYALALQENEDIETYGWRECKDGNQRSCTACGFYFAQRLIKELNVPIGLIDSNWSGSNIVSWIPEEGWSDDPQLVEKHKEFRDNINAIDGAQWHSGMYNAMIAPWTKYAIRGAIWYQGETNASERGFYALEQKAMIKAWRKNWNQGEFPFYWVQLAGYQQPTDELAETSSWPALRDAQTLCLELPKTGQAVIFDIGEADDIHPIDKYDVGNRLALWALAKEFGRDTIEPQSPTFRSLTIEGNQAIVKFDHIGAGLVVAKKSGRAPMQIDWNGELKRFALCGADGQWAWAKGKITGPDTVVLTADGVDAPVAVQYAWQINPEGANLYSAEGLPATPFKTDK